MVSVREMRTKKGKTPKISTLDKVEKTKLKSTKKKTISLKPPKAESGNDDKTLLSQQITKKNKAKFIMPTKGVTEDLVNSSLNALHQLSLHYNKKNSIFDDEKPIFAEINCIKIQSTKVNIKFLLPHSTVASTGEVCLITPDIKKGRRIDHEPTIDRWEDLLRKSGVTNVKTILPIRQLKVEYDQFELKRRLLTQHDFIMVDTRVLSHVSHILGKMFFKKHNMLIPVRLDEEKLKQGIDIGLRTAMLRMNEGATSTITVGHTGMPQDKVKDNILSLVQQMPTKFPGGEANIRSISIKLPLSLSLPIYLTLRPSKTVDVPKLKQNRPKNFMDVEDELSTIPGSKVRVAPDGTVHLKKIEIDTDVNDEDMEEDKEISKDEKNDVQSDSD